MKIFIDASNLIPESGGYIHLKNLLLNIPRQEVEICVAGSSKLIKSLPTSNKKITFYNNIFLNGNLLLRIFWKLLLMNLHIYKNNYSVIFILNGYFFLKPSKIPVAVFIQNFLPFSSHGLRVSNFAEIVKNKILFYLHQYSIKNSELTIYPSKFLSQISKYRSKQTCVINHGVEEIFNQNKKNFKTSIKKTSFKIIYLSKYENYKNHLNLVRACELDKKKGFNISLSFIGINKNEIKNTVLMKVIENSNEEHGKFILLKKIQKHKDIKDIYLKFDLHVYPSICESFGIIILETIASSLPIICSNLGVFREILKKHTLYFDPFDPKDISKKIIQYIQNPKLRKVNTLKLKIISKNFNWKKSSFQTYNILSKISK